MKSLLSTQQTQTALQVVHSTLNFEVQRDPVVVSIVSRKEKFTNPYEVLALVQQASNWDEAWFHHYE